MTNMHLEAVLVIAVLVTTLVVYLFMNKVGMSMELKEALADVIRAGYDVERKGIHVYKNKYEKIVLLKFGEGSIIEVDEEFDDVDLAIARQAELAGD